MCNLKGLSVVYIFHYLYDKVILHRYAQNMTRWLQAECTNEILIRFIYILIKRETFWYVFITSFGLKCCIQTEYILPDFHESQIKYFIRRGHSALDLHNRIVICAFHQ